MSKSFDLSTLINPPHTDSISGRDFGIEYANKIKLTELIQSDEPVVFNIDPEKVKAINDSFIKGLFSGVFEKFKSAEFLKNRISIQSSPFYVKLFEKNWSILQSIYNV
jgi:hypothetical protein